jgi:hypothetical protein
MAAKLTTMVYLFHLHDSCRDVIHTKVVYFFHLRYWDPWPQDLDVILYILFNLHKLLKRGGVMKPNESAKEHPVSFVGNQIRGNQRKQLDARLNGSHSYHTWKLWQATTRVVIVVSNTFRTFLNKLISNLHYVPRNLSVLGPNGSRLHLPEDTTLHQSRYSFPRHYHSECRIP